VVLAKDAPEPPSTSSILPFADQVRAWHEEGIQGVTIHNALVRKHGFTGHYSCVRRFLQKLERKYPKPTVILDFQPGEAAQVDFGSGPKLLDPLTGQVISTWFFVMTLCWSRHQYAEIVRDQTAATWLAFHRRAFEWFGGVPSKVVIDNPKCAIVRACVHDPEVQRSYVSAPRATPSSSPRARRATPRRRGSWSRG
jgi:transposase